MKYFLFSLMVLIYTSANSQDGKIIERTLYDVPDSTLKNIQKIIPDIKSIIDSVNFYHIAYLSDGLKVKGYLAVPKKEGKYSCIIYNRGGFGEFGKITDESFLRDLGQVSSKGYVIIASQYRGNDSGEGKDEFGGKDLNDVLNLIPLLNHITRADTSRIGMFGSSRGGMMTYRTLTRTTKIKAAVVKSGLADLIKWLETRPEMDTTIYAPLIPGYAKNKTATLKERSAVYFAENINRTTPILILQGTADWRVPTNQVLDLVNKLYQLKQPVRFILYEGGQHSLIEHRDNYYTQIINWFDTYLRDKKRWPSIELHGN
ncbi:MAG: prolyl oligopeptidase family serine peptidase [Chitinophagaceae bacterium]